MNKKSFLLLSLFTIAQISLKAAEKITITQMLLDKENEKQNLINMKNKNKEKLNIS